MSILNVNKINPVGGGSTITIAGIASVTSSVTAPSFVGNVTGNITGNADTASGLSGNPSINTTGIVTATSFVPTVGQLSHRNIIVNGACMVAQRGTSSTSGGYQTVDRFPAYHTGGAVTQSQGTLTSGTPFDNGLPNYMRITNTTANTASDHARSIIYKIEAQDIRHSGWNYKSSSSYITFSFYVRSSVSQQFYIMARTQDGTQLQYSFSIGTLSADTWTKVTHSIPGNSNLTFDNNSDRGLEFFIYAALGTDFTSSSVSLNTWGAYTSAARLPDYANTWASTTNATFDITGLQLEVGSVATPFEHRSFADELKRCQRYFYRMQNGSSGSYWIGHTSSYGGNNNIMMVYLPVCMRDNPSVSTSGTASHFQVWGNGTVENLSTLPALRSSNGINPSVIPIDITHNITTGHTRIVRMGSQAYIEFSAEL